MTESELIKYKNQLLETLKYHRYGKIKPHINIQLGTTQAKEEIQSKTNTETTTKKFEQLIEEYVQHLLLEGIDFDTIELTLSHEIFASEFFLRQWQNQRIDYDTTTINEDNFLHSITETDIFIYAKKNGKIVNMQYNKIPLGIINYNEFAAAVIKLGYKIEPTTYEELISTLAKRSGELHSKIKIDFSKNQTHKR